MQYQIDSIEQIKNEFIAIKVRAVLLFKDLSDKQFNFKPVPDKWSAAECLEHLNLTGSGYLKNIQRKKDHDINENHQSLQNYKLRYPLRKFAELTGPDTKIKMPAPKFLQASTSNLSKDVYERFVKVQENFIEIISGAQLNDLGRIKVKWPAFRVMNLHLGEVLIMTLAHQLRHLNQAERVLKSYSDFQK